MIVKTDVVFLLKICVFCLFLTHYGLNLTFTIFLGFPPQCFAAHPKKIRLKAVLSAEFRTFVFHQFRPLSTAHVRFVRFHHGVRMRRGWCHQQHQKRHAEGACVRVVLRAAATKTDRRDSNRAEARAEPPNLR